MDRVRHTKGRMAIQNCLKKTLKAINMGSPKCIRRTLNHRGPYTAESKLKSHLADPQISRNGQESSVYAGLFLIFHFLIFFFFFSFFFISERRSSLLLLVCLLLRSLWFLAAGAVMMSKNKRYGENLFG